MKTIILCGGLGYRLKEETEFKPKPMVAIGNKPMLWHIMKIYAHYGFNEFIIALGYRGDYIKEYFLNQKYFLHDFTLHTKSGSTRIHKPGPTTIDDFKITFVDTGLETLPGERILRVLDYIPKQDSTFMVTYGDGVSDINIDSLLHFHRKQKTIGTITGVHPRTKYGMVRAGEQSRISRFIEKPVLKKDWVNGGFMVFERKFFNYLRPAEMEHEAIRRLIKEQELSLFIHEGFWHAMDTYVDVENLNQMWREDQAGWKVWKE
jgi:glucose-1-phosphate cytidylyltransferase